MSLKQVAFVAVFGFGLSLGATFGCAVAWQKTGHTGISQRYVELIEISDDQIEHWPNQKNYLVRSRVHWDNGNYESALRDIETAMGMADDKRLWKTIQSYLKDTRMVDLTKQRYMWLAHLEMPDVAAPEVDRDVAAPVVAIPPPKMPPPEKILPPVLPPSGIVPPAPVLPPSGIVRQER